ncbi:hypothetical protein H696_05319 [Fonticula alba]|uniref:Integrase catalytic domain-containing protein n=1 Tax=Fonticula alba TaxID=691883 RepID=A0A058Z1E9_FONAL|nr:hypothetical protein H696_05319 [Fonticula alba]KCV68075.1 hypothetical protein H696_05319 [Fonticula alba]|eukprot:XP_009497449.1 hypothetical protein H696_05319 [Fonticula alba]
MTAQGAPSAQILHPDPLIPRMAERFSLLGQWHAFTSFRPGNRALALAITLFRDMLDFAISGQFPSLSAISHFHMLVGTLQDFPPAHLIFVLLLSENASRFPPYATTPLVRLHRNISEQLISNQARDSPLLTGHFFTPDELSRQTHSANIIYPFYDPQAIQYSANSSVILALRHDEAFRREVERTASRAVEVNSIIAAVPASRGDFFDKIPIFSTELINGLAAAQAHTLDKVLSGLKTQMAHLSKAHRDTLEHVYALYTNPAPHPPPSSSTHSAGLIAALAGVVAQDRLKSRTQSTRTTTAPAPIPHRQDASSPANGNITTGTAPALQPPAPAEAHQPAPPARSSAPITLGPPSRPPTSTQAPTSGPFIVQSPPAPPPPFPPPFQYPPHPPTTSSHLQHPPHWIFSPPPTPHDHQQQDPQSSHPSYYAQYSPSIFQGSFHRPHWSPELHRHNMDTLRRCWTPKWAEGVLPVIPFKLDEEHLSRIFANGFPPSSGRPGATPSICIGEPRLGQHYKSIALAVRIRAAIVVFMSTPMSLSAFEELSGLKWIQSLVPPMDPVGLIPLLCPPDTDTLWAYIEFLRRVWITREDMLFSLRIRALALTLTELGIAPDPAEFWAAMSPHCPAHQQPSLRALRSSHFTSIFGPGFIPPLSAPSNTTDVTVTIHRSAQIVSWDGMTAFAGSHHPIRPPPLADGHASPEGNIHAPPPTSPLFGNAPRARGRPSPPDRPRPGPFSLPPKDEAPFRRACSEADAERNTTLASGLGFSILSDKDLTDRIKAWQNEEPLALAEGFSRSKEGLLLRDNRIWIPQAHVQALALLLHELPEINHTGSASLTAILMRGFSGTGFDKAARNATQRCLLCHRFKPKSSSLAPAPSGPAAIPTRPFEALAVDFCSIRLPHHPTKYKVLVMVDTFSRYMMAHVVPASTTGAMALCAFFHSLPPGHPPIATVNAADESPFNCARWKDELISRKISPTYSGPPHDHSNGAAKRAVRSLKQRLAILSNSRKDLTTLNSLLEEATSSHNACPNSLGFSPRELVFGSHAVASLSAIPSILGPHIPHEEAIKTAYDRLVSERTARRPSSLATPAPQSPIKPGDYVLVSLFPRHSPKAQPLGLGPRFSPPTLVESVGASTVKLAAPVEGRKSLHIPLSDIKLYSPPAATSYSSPPSAARPDATSPSAPSNPPDPFPAWGV